MAGDGGGLMALYLLLPTTPERGIRTLAHCPVLTQSELPLSLPLPGDPGGNGGRKARSQPPNQCCKGSCLHPEGQRGEERGTSLQGLRPRAPLAISTAPDDFFSVEGSMGVEENFLKRCYTSAPLSDYVPCSLNTSYPQKRRL